MKASLKDLERATGVSKSTISRVFNNPEKVKSSTLKLVRKKAREIGYVPSRVARRLQAGEGKAQVFGLIIPDILNPFFADIVRGIEDVALDEGFALILNSSEENINRQTDCLETLRMEGVDGIILPPVNEDDDYIKELIKTGMNIVCVDRAVKNINVDTILSDNFEGAYMAVSHLVRLGHKDIAFIGGLDSLTTSQVRLAGYKKVLEDNNLNIRDEYINFGDSKMQNVAVMTESLLRLPNPPSALFTGNNMTTMGAYIGCKRMKIRIGEDLALVGYDDVPWAEAMDPAPTVIDQKTYEIGRKSAEVLLSKIKNPDSSPVTVQIMPKLVVRESCGLKQK